MKREVDLGRKLADTQAPEDRVAIEADPWSAIPALHELQIEVVINLPGGCSIDGHYDRERRLIKVVDRWSEEDSTNVGCMPDVAVQDAWLSGWLNSGVTLFRDHKRLVLSKGDVKVVFQRLDDEG